MFFRMVEEGFNKKIKKRLNEKDVIELLSETYSCEVDKFKNRVDLKSLHPELLSYISNLSLEELVYLKIELATKDMGNLYVPLRIDRIINKILKKSFFVYFFSFSRNSLLLIKDFEWLKELHFLSFEDIEEFGNELASAIKKKYKNVIRKIYKLNDWETKICPRKRRGGLIPRKVKENIIEVEETYPFLWDKARRRLIDLRNEDFISESKKILEESFNNKKLKKRIKSLEKELDSFKNKTIVLKRKLNGIKQKRIKERKKK